MLADALPFDAKNDGLIALYASWGYSGEGMADAVEHLVRRFDSEITLPAEKQRAEWMLAACAENWAMSTSPEQPQMRFETVGNLVAAIPDGPANTARVAAIGKLLERWLGHDPAGARTWALALPESPARGEALTRIIGPLAAQSSSEVVALLAMLPAGTSRDAAVEGFAGTAFRLDPGGALAWLRTIPNPEQQRSSLQQGWQKWAERDPEAAARWRDSAPDLSQAERAALQMW